MIMQDGKKNRRENRIRGFIHFVKKTKEEPLTVLEKALQNVGPTVEVKSRRVGGSNYQAPIE